VIESEFERVTAGNGTMLLSIDADAFCQAHVPGTSAPSPIGIDGTCFPEIAFRAGLHQQVRSLDVVEVNPLFDRDDQSVRWAALGVRQFLVGLRIRLAGEQASEK
jgi:formiminoglutamase/guanidinobutyrase